MKSTTPGAKVHYSIDGSDFQAYTTPISLPNGGVVTAYCTADGYFASPMSTYQFDLFIDRSAWTIKSVSSQEGSNPARYAIDGNTGTFWHTQYSGSTPRHPHSIVIDMNKNYLVTSVLYTARTDGNENGMIREYEIYISNDPENFGTAVATGSFSKTTARQTVTLKTPIEGRYLKLVANSEINGNAWASASEISITAKVNDAQAIEVIPHSELSVRPDHLYTLSGTAVGIYAAIPSAETPHIPQGIYILGGKKILVR